MRRLDAEIATKISAETAPYFRPCLSSDFTTNPCKISTKLSDKFDNEFAARASFYLYTDFGRDASWDGANL